MALYVRVLGVDRFMGKSLSFLTLFIFLVQCTPVQKQSAFKGMDIEGLLFETANSVDNSLRVLAHTQKIYPQQVINTEPLITAKGGMGGRATLDWSGPIEPLLQRIGDLTHYKLKVLGHSPAIPVIVSITAKDSLVADIVKDAGLQATKRANVVVYPNNRIIELRYLPV